MGATVLLRNDMLDMKRVLLLMLLTQATVFSAMVRAVLHL
jgi:hypothetical protein